MKLFSLIYKIHRKIISLISSKFEQIASDIVLKGNNIKCGIGFISNGVPNIDVWREGEMVIGNNFKINNGSKYNKIGRQQRCIFVVANNAQLHIGNNVGMSGVAIVCHNKIIIGNNVKIGGNTVIYDTDFHSLDHNIRAHPLNDRLNTKTAAIIIEDHVFIGAHSTILKGITIGENSIVGACSVITKDIPPNQIWAGNPGKFIRNI